MKQAEESEAEKDLKTGKFYYPSTNSASAGATGMLHGYCMKHDSWRIIRPVFKLNSAEVERRARVRAWGANHEAERGRFNLEVRQFLQAAVCDFAAKAQSRMRT
jgi:hypothetical protein